MSAVQLIQSTSLTSASSAITFSQIPATWTHLRVTMQGVVNADSFNPTIRFNGDNGTNYSYVRTGVRPSQVSQDRGDNQTSIIGSMHTVTNLLCSSTIDIFSYTNTNVHKMVLIFYGAQSTTTSRNCGLWRSLSAISEVSLRADGANSGQFTAGTTAQLWGIA